MCNQDPDKQITLLLGFFHGDGDKEAYEKIKVNDAPQQYGNVILVDTEYKSIDEYSKYAKEYKLVLKKVDVVDTISSKVMIEPNKKIMLFFLFVDRTVAEKFFKKEEIHKERSDKDSHLIGNGCFVYVDNKDKYKYDGYTNKDNIILKAEVLEYSIDEDDSWFKDLSSWLKPRMDRIKKQLNKKLTD